MTLRISLRNDEPLIVNGAVLRAVGRTDLVLENDATILRGRDVMKPQDANTPARRLYFACMMAYIDPANREQHQVALLEKLEALLTALRSPEAKAVCVAFAEKVAVGDFYHALTECRWLIDYETEALARLAPAAAPDI